MSDCLDCHQVPLPAHLQQTYARPREGIKPTVDKYYVNGGGKHTQTAHYPLYPGTEAAGTQYSYSSSRGPAQPPIPPSNTSHQPRRWAGRSNFYTTTDYSKKIPAGLQKPSSKPYSQDSWELNPKNDATYGITRRNPYADGYDEEGFAVEPTGKYLTTVAPRIGAFKEFIVETRLQNRGQMQVPPNQPTRLW